MAKTSPPASRAASRLRGFRKRLKWTMTQAAAWYGVTLATWSRWESGARPTPEHLWRRIEEMKAAPQ